MQAMVGGGGDSRISPVVRVLGFHKCGLGLVLVKQLHMLNCIPLGFNKMVISTSIIIITGIIIIVRYCRFL